MLVISIFSFSHNVFYPIKENFHHLRDIEIVDCKWFEVGQGAFVEDNDAMSSIRYFEKSCNIICAKPKEVNPMKLISLRQISVSTALKYITDNSV